MPLDEKRLVMWRASWPLPPMRRIEDILEVEEGARSECCGLFDCELCL